MATNNGDNHQSVDDTLTISIISVSSQHHRVILLTLFPFRTVTPDEKHLFPMRFACNQYSRDSVSVGVVVGIFWLFFSLLIVVVVFVVSLSFYIQHRIDLMHSIGSHLSNQINQSVRRTNEVIADTHLQNKQWTWAEARTYQPTYSVHDFL